MALFSQDDSDEDETPDMGSAFAGGQQPAEPDDQTEAPVPEAVDQADGPAPAPVDDANAYAQSPEEQDSMLDRPGGPGDYPYPMQDDVDESAPSQYAQPVEGGGGGAPQDSDASRLPAMPQYVDNLPNYQALEHQIASFNPKDYKPSVARSIAAALSGAAVAFGSRNPAEGLKVAEGVSGAPLARAQAQEQQRESATRQTIADVNAQNQTRQAQYQNRRQAANDAALNDQRNAQAALRNQTAYEKSLKLVPVDPKNPFGEWQQVDPTGKVVARGQETPASVKNDLAYQTQLRIQKIAQANAEGKAIGLSGEHLQRYVSEIMGSKNAFPTEHETINVREGGYSSPGGNNGGQQNPQGAIPARAQAVVAKANGAKETFAQQYQRDPETGDYTKVSTGAKLPAKDFDAAIDKYRTDANVALSRIGYQVDPQGNFGPVGQQAAPNATPAAPTRAAAPQPAPAAPPQAAAGKITIRDGQGKTLDVATARQYLAKAGGDKQKARQLATQDHWSF